MPPKKAEQQPKERESRPASCVVCGDAAIGYNYGAPSCASCKAFFRRMVIKKQSFTCCLRNGVCARDESAKPCRTCRYERCLKGGMIPSHVTGADLTEPNSELPPSDDPSASTSVSSRQEAEADKASVECQTDGSGNFEKADDAPCDPGPSTLRQDDSRELQIVPNPFRIESKMELMMQNLISLEAAHQKLRISTFTPRLLPGLRIDDFAFVPSKLGNKFEEMYSPAYEPFSEMLFPAEVLIKQRIVIDISNFDYSARKLWVIQDVVYTIEFIKALPIYQLMDDCSKKVLAASALTCTNLGIAYYSYCQNSDRTIYPDGSVVTWTGDIQAMAPDSTRFHTCLIAALREAQIDAREYSLLKNIIICNPTLEGLQQHDSTLLQHEKERYTKTLLSYVLSRSGVSEGPARFARILSIVDVVHKLTSWQKGTYICSFAMGLAKPITPFAESIFSSQ